MKAIIIIPQGFTGGSVVRNLPPNAGNTETQVQSLGQEGPLEEAMAIHSSFLSWRVLWTEEHGGFSPKGHKELDVA